MDGGGVNLDEQQISHWRDDLLANGRSVQSPRWSTGSVGAQAVVPSYLMV